MTPPPDVRVLIVDDSPVAREVLKTVLEADAGIRVIGMAGTGHEAVELTGRLRPDIVTMDLVMPGMDGMEATHHIMARYPTPILFLSAFIGREGSYSRSDVLAAGALDVVEKPPTMPDPRWQTGAGSLVQKVKSLAKVTVVTHMHRASRVEGRPSSAAAPRRHARGGDRRVDGRAQSARRLTVVVALGLRPGRGRDPAHGRRFPSRHGRVAAPALRADRQGGEDRRSPGVGAHLVRTAVVAFDGVHERAGADRRQRAGARVPAFH